MMGGERTDQPEGRIEDGGYWMFSQQEHSGDERGRNTEPMTTLMRLERMKERKNTSPYEQRQAMRNKNECIRINTDDTEEVTCAHSGNEHTSRSAPTTKAMKHAGQPHT